MTDAVHMSRALGGFRKQGIDSVPAACGHRATALKLKIDNFIPSTEAIKDLASVLYEWLGIG